MVSNQFPPSQVFFYTKKETFEHALSCDVEKTQVANNQGNLAFFYLQVVSDFQIAKESG